MGFNLAGLIDSALETAAETFDDIDDYLDFGFNDPLDDFSTAEVLQNKATSITSAQERINRAEAEEKKVNPHIDLTEVERANPTNLNFPNVGGLPTPVLIAGGLVGGFVLLKMLKVI